MTAIILLNWNGCDDTLACLKSLSAVKGKDFYVVVADNGSTDDSIGRLLDWGSKHTKRMLIIRLFLMFISKIRLLLPKL